MSTPEVGARRTLAAAIYADFIREAAEFAAGGQVPDWLAWSHRLAIALGGLLDALGQADAIVLRTSGASSGMAADGTGRLSPADRLIVLGALADAATWAGYTGRRADLAAYRRLSLALGGPGGQS